MSDLTTHTQDAARELAIRVHGALHAAAARVRELPSETRGQTAAEYMGILLVVSVIIAALFASQVDEKIVTAAEGLIDKIGKGEKGGG